MTRDFHLALGRQPTYPGALRWSMGQLKRYLPGKIKRPIESTLHLHVHLRNRLRGKPIVHLLHIRKTGGTAVRHAIDGVRNTPRFTLEFHTHNVGLRDIPVGDHFAFFLRDPIKRFVSGFNSRLRQGQPRYYTPWTRAERMSFGQFSSPQALAGTLFSRDFEQRQAAEQAMHAIRNLNSSYWDWFGSEEEIIARHTELFFVGFLEELETDFARFRDKLGLPPDIGLPSTATEAHRNPATASTELDQQAQRNLRHWYASDYEFIRLIQELESG